MLQDKHLGGVASLSDLCPTSNLNNSGYCLKNAKKVLDMSDPSRALLEILLLSQEIFFYYLPVCSLMSACSLFSSFGRDCLHPDVVPYFDIGIFSVVKTC